MQCNRVTRSLLGVQRGGGGKWRNGTGYQEVQGVYMGHKYIETNQTSCICILTEKNSNYMIIKYQAVTIT